MAMPYATLKIMAANVLEKGVVSIPAVNIMAYLTAGYDA